MTAAGEALVGSASAERWPSELVDCYAHHAAPLTGYLVSLVGDVGVAQDIAQESFVRLFARWRHVEHPRAYVYLTAVNFARRHWRRIGYETARPPPTRGCETSSKGCRHDCGRRCCCTTTPICPSRKSAR